MTRPRRDERGAVLVMVGVFAVAMFAMTAFVVDLGNQRQNRLQLATATDAAALDVAQEWANTGLDAVAAGFAATPVVDRWRCDAVARATVRENNAGLDPDSVTCIADDRGDWGIVTVAASETVENLFGQVADTPEGTTRSTTSVKVSGAAQGGVRPFAVCAKLPVIKNFIAGLTGPGDDVRVDAVKHLTPECGSASGNWGLLDLGGKGASAVGALFAEGYDKSVKRSTTPTSCADTEPESCFTAAPGAKWNSGPVRSALSFLEGPAGCEAGGPEFSVPTYDAVLDPHGANAKFPLSGFLRVQLMCFTTGGSNLNSLTLKLVSYEPDECCSGVSATNRILEICDVGTITGVLGPDYASSCGTPASAPPAVGSGCLVRPISPAARDVLVDGGGLSTGALTVEVTVDDATRCGDLRLRAVVQGTERLVPASAPSRSSNTYHYSFPSGTDFGIGGTFLTLVVYEDDYVWDQTATLHTVLDSGTPAPGPLCQITGSAVEPATVTLEPRKDRGSKADEMITSQAAVWTTTFEWPSSCGEVYAELRKVDDPSKTLGIGSAKVSAVMKFTLPKGTMAEPGVWRSHYYVDGGGTSLGSGPAITVKSAG